MTQIIPVVSYPDQTFRVTLEGTPLDMRIYWSAFDASTRALIGDGIEGQWYMDMSNADLSINLKGVALVTGADILEPHGYSQFGGLWMAGPGDMTFSSLGDTHQLLYVPVDEQEAFNRAIGWRV